MQINRLSRIVALVIVGLLLVAAIFAPQFRGRRQQVVLLYQDWRWKSLSIEHYRFSLGIGCLCEVSWNTPLQIEVDHGVIVAIQDSEGMDVPIEAYREGSSNMFADFREWYTIDGFVASAMNILANNNDVIINYDPTYSFPISVGAPSTYEGSEDGWGMYIDNFEVLQ